MKISEPKVLQRSLINIIETRPGITQHEIVSLLDSSQQVVSYNLTQLTRNNIIRFEHNGRENKYYVNPETAYSYQYQDQFQSLYQFQQIPPGIEPESYMTPDDKLKSKKI